MTVLLAWICLLIAVVTDVQITKRLAQSRGLLSTHVWGLSSSNLLGYRDEENVETRAVHRSLSARKFSYVFAWVVVIFVWGLE